MERGLEARYQRALSQPLLIVSTAPSFYVVKGSKGDHYNVLIEDDGIHCSCPDALRESPPLCKHRILVLLNVYKFKWEDVLDLARLLEGEFYDTLKDLVPIDVTTIDPRETDSCAICLEDMCAPALHCKAKCGTMYHQACITSWLSTAPSCPLCRSAWV